MVGTLVQVYIFVHCFVVGWYMFLIVPLGSFSVGTGRLSVKILYLGLFRSYLFLYCAVVLMIYLL